ncbi:alkene reductase [Salinisphaera orenii]|uniref:alkene reductase n=1 Tax=Salinisphaera orenii TaxID=856731 RepID=UPI000DBE6086
MISTNSSTPGLFSPHQLGALELPHRVLMAPLTRNRAGPGFVPQAMNVTYYQQRASAGLIISEATQVAPEGLGYPDTPGIYSDAQVEGWKQVTDAVHEAGGRIVLQLWHVGRISHPDLQPDGALPVAPSAIQPAGEASTYSGNKPFVTPRALEADELPAIREQYRRGAANARKAGLDGVEIHNANGYLLDQFLRDGSNHRTDEYGGSIDNRMRFPLEVLEAVLGEWPADRVGVRLSPSGTMNDMHDTNPRETFGHMVSALNAYDLAYLHLVEPMASDLRHGSPGIPTAYFRPLYRGNLVVNAEYDGASADRAISAGLADAVAFGKPYIANPDLPTRLYQNRALNEQDPSRFYGGDERGYIDYPPLEQITA